MVNSSLTLFLLLCLLVLPPVEAHAMAHRLRIAPRLIVASLRTEYKEDPIGIDEMRPRLSWQLQSLQADQRALTQFAYQVRVASNLSELQLGRSLVWDSGEVRSGDSIQQAYGGPPLRSGQRYYWQVRVWIGADQASEWSTPAFWEMGLLSASNWKASWIEPDLREDTSKSGPAPMMRREFKLNGVVDSARAYVTSHGLYEMQLNGQRVGNEVFTPGWTSYKKRLQYQTFDVAPLLKSGDNAVGVLLGNGWYRGLIGFEGQRNAYGDRLGLLVQISVRYKDGREELITTDQNWKATTSPILMSEIYNGEIYDARLEKPGWSMAGFDDTGWSRVRVVNHRKDDLVAPAGPPVRRTQEVMPVKVVKTPAGETVVDMGQNMVGWVRIKVQGPAGTVVTLRHAEVLDKDGNFYTRNLRAAEQTLRYTLKGGGAETFEPHFTFQGFRYVEVDGYPGELTTASLVGVVVHSEMRSTGEFETSSKLINQLQQNIVWGQKGNFLDVRTAAFNMDVAGFFSKWLKDVALDQFENGSVPWVVPDVLSSPGKPAGGSAAWSDVAVIIPWNMYLSYGDKRILETQYQSMSRWVEYERQRAGDDYIWDGDFHFGDWLAFATTRPDYPGATTSKDLIATAFFAHSTDLLQRTAQVLGKQNDAARFAELLSRIKKAFCREFVTETGRVGEDTQTAYALALQFDLLPDELRPIAAKRLAQEVRRRGHLTTGFVGTPYLCHVLSRYGYLDEAYLLLNREEYPSWLYPVKTGATTIWERWDGLKPDGSFQDKEMNSFNHYAYGAIGEWMYRVMAGIEIDEAAPGYKHILIQPQPGGRFTSVKASHTTMYGKVSSAWTLSNDKFELAVEIPPNTRATVRMPRANLANVTEGGQALTARPGISNPRQDGESVTMDIGSGRYLFACDATKPARP